MFHLPKANQKNDLTNRNHFSYPIPVQIVTGILCLILNVTVVYFAQTPNNPLFLDTIFTLTAACFGWISGLIVSCLSNLMYWLFVNFEDGSVWFTFCSISIVVIIRLFVQNKSKLTFLDLLSIYLLSVLAISLEGSIIYTILYNTTSFKETTGVKHFTLILVRQQVPLIFGAFLARIPINLIDKAIATVLGWLVFLVSAKVYSKWETKKS